MSIGTPLLHPDDPVNAVKEKFDRRWPAKLFEGRAVN